MNLFKGQIAVVTGAASGIGLAISLRLAEEGAKVYLLDIDHIKLQQLRSQYLSSKLLLELVTIDITSETEVKSCFDQIIFQDGKVDIVVNNAGRQHIDLIEDFPSAKFENMIKLMLIAPFYVIKQIIPAMKTNNYGRILNIASINGLVGFAGKSAYNSAKHGLIGLTKAVALETAKNDITVNALCPGYVDTALVRNQLQELANQRGVAFDDVLEKIIYPLVPQSRLLQVEEIVDYVEFLLSPKSKGVTGQSIVIDGGYTAQ